MLHILQLHVLLCRNCFAVQSLGTFLHLNFQYFMTWTHQGSLTFSCPSTLTYHICSCSTLNRHLYVSYSGYIQSIAAVNCRDLVTDKKLDLGKGCGYDAS
ncbi:hypothetical protein F4781DRAFT_415400 [Annulohypoxylon bovei var. microspora]|nr:hypothetical protein F4781DRAFT_415400 [Annulohypoxylon bovei var. microspora]